MDLRGRSLLKDTDLSAGEFRYLVDPGCPAGAGKAHG